jgi:hypothetical protein
MARRLKREEVMTIGGRGATALRRRSNDLGRRGNGRL